MRDYRVLAVAGLTLVAFALRLAEIDESLFGDELFTYNVVRSHGLIDTFSAVKNTAITPPLHYVLAWLTSRLAEPTIWVRVPSLVLGTATVPLVYLLGVRTVGRGAGLIAAALVAISPFAVFYGDEARAYATLGFLLTVSTLSLLTALETDRLRWWGLFALSSCAALYAHYTAVYVLFAQAAWAVWVHRDRLRRLALAHAAVGIGYLPWVPAYLDQRNNPGIDALNALAPLSLESIRTQLVRVFPGQPFVAVGDLPGKLAAALIAVVLGAALLVAATRAVRGLATPSRTLVLVWLLALATPVGAILYSLVSSNILLSRNMMASLPAFCLVLGALLASLGRPLAAVAAATVIALVGVGTLKTLDADYQRPAYRDVAHLIDREADPGDPVVEAQVFPPFGALSRTLQVHFDRSHPIFRMGVDDRTAWRQAARAGGAFVVVPLEGDPAISAGQLRRAGNEAAAAGLHQTDARTYPGLFKLRVIGYGGK